MLSKFQEFVWISQINRIFQKKEGGKNLRIGEELKRGAAPAPPHGARNLRAHDSCLYILFCYSAPGCILYRECTHPCYN
jgi:hypothetical protein